MDRSYPSPKEQLLWRYEDLLARREELLACGSSGNSGLLIDDICYTLPEHLCSLGDVETAIEFAEDDLMRKYHTTPNHNNKQADASVTITGIRFDMLYTKRHTV